MFGKCIVGSAHLFDGSSKRTRHRQLDEGAAQRIRVEDAQQWPGNVQEILPHPYLHLGIMAVKQTPILNPADIDVNTVYCRE